METYVLKLFIAGRTSRANVAIENLRRICEEDLANQYMLELIDVIEHPDLAEAEKILATPTVVKTLPPPIRRVIGDLSDASKVLLGLDIVPVPRTAEEPHIAVRQAETKP